MVNNAFAFTFKEARLSTTCGSGLEHDKFVGQISTIMRLITSKDGDLISRFDKINENDIDKASLKQLLITNQEPAKSGKLKGQLPLELIFGFCKTFLKKTKKLRFQLTFKTEDTEDSINTTLGDSINKTFENLNLYVPAFIPSPKTQAMFIESNTSNYSISYDTWTTYRKNVNDQLEFQVDIGSAQNINSPE